MTHHSRSGDFGLLRDSYQKGRRDYPDTIIDFCLAHHNQRGGVLDIGCGTGISTRQIRRRLPTATSITGTDVEETMLEVARLHDDGIVYLVAPASELPFNDFAFETVTAFGSFHWFANAPTISEIQRVLMPGGYFCVVNKSNRFAKDLKTIISEETSQFLPDIKKDYDPHTILLEYGFVGVEKCTVEVKDTYTIDEAMQYYHSMSFSNFVLEEKKEKVDGRVREYFQTLADKGGIISGVQTVAAVTGRIA